MADSLIRIGILGAASIAPMALIDPAKENAEVIVAAVAARDVPRAQAFASQHDIPTVHGDYGALIADPDIDAIYNRCRTAYTGAGPGPHSPRANTCCAKSRSPLTRPRHAKSPSWQRIRTAW